MADFPEGSSVTPITQGGLLARIGQATRSVIAGVTNGSWFSPMQPLQPMAPNDVRGRQFDYRVGENLSYIPRSNEGIGFGDLRALADNCDVLRSVIEARKDQLAALDWVVRPRQAESGNPSNIWARRTDQIPQVSQDVRDRIKSITDFFQKPDKVNTWDQWQRALLEDQFVIDAASIYRHPTRGGKLYSLELMDGATIKPLLSYGGRRPMPPSPAFQQVLHGVPAVDYTSEELLYCPKNVRTHKIYGYSPVEQVIVTVNTAIRRAIHQLEFYRAGSLPDSFVGLPDTWSLANVKDFQIWFDSMLSGNLANRRRVRFMPGQFKYQETKPIDLKDMYDEWLARLICFVFSVSPEPFIQHINRGSAQTSRDRALQEGLAPSQRWTKQIVDGIIAADFKSPDLEFAYLEDREQDPSAQANIDVAYAKAGIKSVDEIRSARGLAPLGGPYARPMLATAQGYVPVGQLTSVIAAEANAELQTDEGPDDSQNSGTDDGPSEGDGRGVRQTPGGKQSAGARQPEE